MGGIIALTIRESSGKEWRGSCWTNVLPNGLFAAPFYNKRTSQRHVKKWLSELLAHRKSNPKLEELWGDWNMLAPVEYGVVVIDYKDNFLISAQGYNSPHSMHISDMDTEKFVKLYPMGIISNCRTGLGKDKTLNKRERDALFKKVVKVEEFNKEHDTYGEYSERTDKRPKVPFVLYDLKIPFKTYIHSMGADRSTLEEIQKHFTLSKKELKAWKEYLGNR
jgi:hypothetical protein